MVLAQQLLHCLLENSDFFPSSPKGHAMLNVSYLLLSMVVVAFLVIPCLGQKNQDTVFQKDGEIIVGHIFEDNHGSNLKIRIDSQGVLLLNYNSIQKINRVPKSSH